MPRAEWRTDESAHWKLEILTELIFDFASFGILWSYIIWVAGSKEVRLAESLKLCSLAPLSALVCSKEKHPTGEVSVGEYTYYTREKTFNITSCSLCLGKCAKDTRL